MKRNNPYVIVLGGSLSYAWKKHPYMTVWLIVCIAVGIYTGITEPSVVSLISGIATGFLPLIVKNIGIALLSLDSWERSKFQKQKTLRRERYMQYMKEYTEKVMSDQK